MNDIETAKLGMYETVLSFLSENRDIIAGIRAFSWSISKLRRIIDEIKVKDKEVSSKTLEKAILSSECREKLVFLLVPIASALNNYAREKDDFYLRQKTRYTQSCLLRMKDKELSDKALGLLLICSNLLPYLTKFGITAYALDELRMKIENFKYALESKNSVFISNTVSSSFEGLFMEADRIMSRNLDNYVETLEEDVPEFYEDYLAARSLENQDQKKLLMEIEEEE